MIVKNEVIICMMLYSMVLHLDNWQKAKSKKQNAKDKRQLSFALC